MTVALTNTSGRPLIFVLAHDEYCEALGTCACDVRQGRKALRLPGSLTLATGVTVEGLEDAILALPDAARAVRQGRLAVSRAASPATEALDSPTTPTPAPPEAGSTPEATKARKKRGT